VTSLNHSERDLRSIRLPMLGKVVPSDGVVPWVVLDAAGEPVGPIMRYLRDFVARGNRPGSVRSYAYDLRRWWRFLLCTTSTTATPVGGHCVWSLGA
jgi:hypothetical protein